MAVLNFDLVSNLHLAPEPTQPHTMVADIKRMREMAIFTPGDPESHWHDRFGSLRPPFAVDARGTRVTTERSMGNGLWVPLPRPLIERGGGRTSGERRSSPKVASRASARLRAFKVYFWVGPTGSTTRPRSR